MDWKRKCNYSAKYWTATKIPQTPVHCAVRGFDDKDCILRQSVCSRRFAKPRCPCRYRTECCGSRKGDRRSVSQVSRQIRQAAAAIMRSKEALLNMSPLLWDITPLSHDWSHTSLRILRLRVPDQMKTPCAWRLLKLATPSKLQRLSTLHVLLFLHHMYLARMLSLHLH